MKIIDKIASAIMYVTAIVGTVSILIGIAMMVATITPSRELTDQARTMAESGYETYLNGSEVDINNLDLKHYHITIDDENNKILLTSK